MSPYYHSIQINPNLCDGRMKCMRICPTQAIRVRDGKASIIENKCIDCGECIKVCPHQAIVPLTDPFGELGRFKHTVAISSPALYAQFGREILPAEILAGMKELSFDDALDLAPFCGEVSFAIQEYIREYNGPKPLISITCPTVVRLIQVKYPDLIDHIIPVDTPREIAAREIKRKKSKELGLKEEEIGTFYLTPCPAKMISIRQPAEKGKSNLDGAISISDAYGPLLTAMDKMEKGHYREALENICILGIGWAVAGGICRTLRLKKSLAVSGVPDILDVFDDIERGKLRDIDFIEAYSCTHGCVGGSLTVENQYNSYNKIIALIETLQYENIKACPDIREVRKRYKQNYFQIEGKFKPRPLTPLDNDLTKAIKKSKKKEEIYASLPQIDCGVCGSPTCLTFAEDVVMGEASVSDCIFDSPKRHSFLTQKMLDLLDKSTSSKHTQKIPKKE